MKKNLATWDRIVRALVAIVLAVFYVTGVVSGALGIVFLVFSVVFLLTAIFGICPLYLLFKLSTNKS